ncbi:hypothetical protein, partial [Haematobacter massiliensis]|uniref:hypothetical protein n=1 Tax=Haematobacter massiliensis TaxID=195105 RepID=UPI0023F0E336
GREKQQAGGTRAGAGRGLTTGLPCLSLPDPHTDPTGRAKPMASLPDLPSRISPPGLPRQNIPEARMATARL